MAPTDNTFPSDTPNQTSPTPLPSNAATASPNINQSELESLNRNQERIKSLLNEASESAVDQQILNTQSEINALQNQLKDYQSNEAALHQTIQTRVQLTEALARQTISHLNARVRALERQQRSTQYELNQTSFYNDPNVPDKSAKLQAILSQTQNEITALTAAEENLHIQNERDLAALNTESFNAEKNIQSMIQATQAQISFLEGDLTQLNEQKRNAQNTATLLRLELQDVEQKIKTLSSH